MRKKINLKLMERRTLKSTYVACVETTLALAMATIT